MIASDRRIKSERFDKKWAWPVAATTPIAILVLLQGGYSGLSTCACGIFVGLLVAIAWLKKSIRKCSLPAVSTAFMLLMLASVFSLLANGLTLTTLSIGFLCSSTHTAMKVANENGDYAQCEQLFRGNAFALNDVAAQERYIEALYGQHRYIEVAMLFEKLDYQTDVETEFAALSYYSIGDGADASLTQIRRMESLPYDYRFFQSSRKLVETYGLDDSMIKRYNEAIICANRMSREASGPFLKAVEIDEYLSQVRAS